MEGCLERSNGGYSVEYFSLGFFDLGLEPPSSVAEGVLCVLLFVVVAVDVLFVTFVEDVVVEAAEVVVAIAEVQVLSSVIGEVMGPERVLGASPAEEEAFAGC